MKPWSLPSVQSVTSFSDLKRFTAQALTNFYQLFNGGIGFQDNINCEIVVATINTSNTPVNHKLGVVPIGFIVIGANDTQYPRNGTIAWTDKTIYLIANATAAYTIIILGS